MLTMVIAEDDRLDRESLRGAADAWDALGISVSGVAENGLQALQLARELRPDLLLTDIRMPQMSGLDLARAVRREGLGTRIVLISGYEDFAYAQAGIEAGVDGYLLKPYTIGELSDALGAAAAKCAEEKRRRREEEIREKLLEDSLPLLEEKLLENAIHGRYRDGAELAGRMRALGRDFSGMQLLLLLLRVDERDAGAAPGPVETLSLMALVQEGTAGYAYRRVLQGGNAETIVVLGDEPCRLRDKHAVERVAQDICRSLAMERGAHPVVGVSRPAAGLEGLAAAFLEAREAAEHSFTLGRDRAIFIDDVAPGDARYPNVAPHAEGMLQALRAGNGEEAGQALDALFAELGRYPSVTGEYAANVCLTCYLQALLAVTEATGGGSGSDPQPQCAELMRSGTLPELRERMGALTDGLCLAVAEQAGRRIRDTVQRVKDIIAQKYMQDITLESIAAEVYLSPNYLNTVFRRGAGTSITKWLTDVRIRRAVELLADPQAPVGRVAESVGYGNAAYFSTVFKKHTGLTPVEYRSRNHP